MKPKYVSELIRGMLVFLVLLAAIVVTFLSLGSRPENWNEVATLRKENFLIVGPLWAAVAFLVFPRHPIKAIIVSVLAYLLPASGLSLFQSSVYTARIDCRKITCTNRLRQIGLALHTYEQLYGVLPPAYIPDANGKPMHSWRVLLLPLLGGKDIYKRYSFNAPWDGPNNRKLHDAIIRVYRCPTDEAQNANPTMTNYVAVTGKDTAWSGPISTRLNNIRDGTDKTLLVVEIANSGIHWMQPKDMLFSEMDFRINGTPGNSVSSCHPMGANAVFADGSCFFLGKNLSPTQLRALLTIDGGENVSRNNISN